MSEKITFRELIESIAEETDNPKKFTRSFLRDLVDLIHGGLEEDGKVNIAGLGKFDLRRVDERDGYNPQTGRSMTIPAHNKVVFKPYKELRELVNAPYAHLEAEIIGEEGDRSPAPEEKESTGAPSSPAGSSAGPPPAVGGKKGSGSKRYLLWTAGAILLLLTAGSAYLLTGSQSAGDSPSDMEPAGRAMITEQQDRNTSRSRQQQEDPAAGEQSRQTDQQENRMTESGRQEENSVAENESGREENGTAEDLAIDRGQTLWGVAQNRYGDPHLWPWIYDANKPLIDDPDLIIAGQTLRIPLPSGVQQSLTSADSLEVAKGYVETYRWYRDENQERARLCLWVATTYDEEVLDKTAVDVDEDDLAFANRLQVP